MKNAEAEQVCSKIVSETSFCQTRGLHFSLVFHAKSEGDVRLFETNPLPPPHFQNNDCLSHHTAKFGSPPAFNNRKRVVKTLCRDKSL